jgi:hypothetical protein
MKDINGLIYLSHIRKTKQVAKDKKQANKYYQTALLKDDQCSDEVSEEVLENVPLIEKENNRRTGSERRKTQQNRGRYFESRLEKNRRYKKEVFIVI